MKIFSICSFVFILGLMLVKPASAQLYKVTQLLYEVPDQHLLAVLKNDQSNSLVLEGKTVSPSTFSKERNRIFLLLSPKNFTLKMKDIGFKVDTTLQKGACTVVTIVKSENNF